ncbi:chemotaxis protein CheB [Streptosporangium sp. NBC_01469]|uniref:chemotaxis protein CheB n=1 Tax=Streptosporangium sp. NBC_01469 TaxID=2903898 RepID=UPI002E2B0AEF|nr:chemotaxis protein CheB [Streptosporangium sp. NBC_01469]
MVALIASAGGLEALSRVLAPLPADLPAALLVALHQDPAHNSMLAAILARRTALEVRVAVDGAALQAGLVLVVPPGHHLLVASPERVAFIATGGLPPPRPSADLLLATLAVTCGPRALAVILTGTGHDGQAGVRAVVHRGGAVFAQDESSSAFFAMPAAAIATGQVSRVLALDDIAAAITTHITPT